VSASVKPDMVRYQVRFGATPTSPIGPPVPCADPKPGRELCPYLEPDYVPNYETAVPQAIRSCRASFVSFRPLTEGAVLALFDVPPAQATTVEACIKQRLPQGYVEPAP